MQVAHFLEADLQPWAISLVAAVTVDDLQPSAISLVAAVTVDDLQPSAISLVAAVTVEDLQPSEHQVTPGAPAAVFQLSEEWKRLFRSCDHYWHGLLQQRLNELAPIGDTLDTVLHAARLPLEQRLASIPEVWRPAVVGSRMDTAGELSLDCSDVAAACDVMPAIQGLRALVIPGRAGSYSRGGARAGAEPPVDAGSV